MKHPELNLNEIERIKEKYDKELTDLIKRFENEVGIIPFSGGLYVDGVKVIITNGHASENISKYYMIDLAI